ncbi:uncharacterized protein isoform X1 [Leptinotarsa decemlineata]|uniref:uncharacterized protein isoform X1 n=1 Tax=Leptinotarsa decemlineata TaxID=7539 RepID=UPI003D305A0C
MVQSELFSTAHKKPYDNRSIIPNKKFGLDADKKTSYVKENKGANPGSKKENSAWGSTFKNKEHFASLHHF